MPSPRSIPYDEFRTFKEETNVKLASIETKLDILMKTNGGEGKKRGSEDNNGGATKAVALYALRLAEVAVVALASAVAGVLAFVKMRG